ncbi:MAG: hypothetical protein AAF587_44845 [Bacteroidota bacterium]
MIPLIEIRYSFFREPKKNGSLGELASYNELGNLSSYRTMWTWGKPERKTGFLVEAEMNLASASCLDVGMLPGRCSPDAEEGKGKARKVGVLSSIKPYSERNGFIDQLIRFAVYFVDLLISMALRICLILLYSLCYIYAM